MKGVDAADRERHGVPRVLLPDRARFNACAPRRLVLTYIIIVPASSFAACNCCFKLHSVRY